VAHAVQPNIRVTKVARQKAKDTMRGLRRREALTAFLFIAPTFVGFFIFTLGPMLASLGLSLFDWDALSPPIFIGLDNFRFLLEDSRFLNAFRNVAGFAGLVMLLNVVVSLGLAVALQTKMPTPLRYFFRTSYFLPVVTSMASIAIILSFVFHKELGIANYYLGLIGVERVPWLTSSSWALLTVVLTTVWKTFGFDLILFVAGMNNVPRQFYEVAELDGANAWHRFWSITLPLISPTIFFALVIGIISSFQVFDQVYIMTRGGPGDATRTIVMTIYDDAFGSLRLGYGSAMVHYQ
jgi:multiple sugar transport system permease protein